MCAKIFGVLLLTAGVIVGITVLVALVSTALSMPPLGHSSGNRGTQAVGDGGCIPFRLQICRLRHSGFVMQPRSGERFGARGVNV